jgi:Protein of unknown function (DUF2778)
VWQYEQSSGFLVAPDGTKLYPSGYAGRDSGKNNPSMQAIKYVGPLPQGFYTMTELIEDDPVTGRYTIVLVPDPSNEMFGRDTFRIHGDSIEEPGNASDGCIVQYLTNRVTAWTSPDHRLEVVATLPSSGHPAFT